MTERKMMKRLLIGAAAALALVLAVTLVLPMSASAFGGKFGGFGHGGFGHGGGADRGAQLADALGISVDDLQAAQEKAALAGLAQALDEGLITEEQADQMKARMALKSYLDPQALMAEALGMTVDELEAALEDGKTVRDLLDEQGLDMQTFRDNMQAAHEKAIDQAVADGVITAEQAEAMKNHERGGKFGGHGRGGGRMGPGGCGGHTVPGEPGGFGSPGFFRGTGEPSQDA